MSLDTTLYSNALSFLNLSGKIFRRINFRRNKFSQLGTWSWKSRKFLPPENFPLYIILAWMFSQFPWQKGLRWLLAVALLGVEIGMESGLGYDSFGFLVSLKREGRGGFMLRGGKIGNQSNIHKFTTHLPFPWPNTIDKTVPASHTGTRSDCRLLAVSRRGALPVCMSLVWRWNRQRCAHILFSASSSYPSRIHCSQVNRDRSSFRVKPTDSSFSQYLSFPCQSSDLK